MLCLLAYEPTEWDTFTSRARPADERPTPARTVALAGVQRGDLWVVLPEPPAPRPLLALWRIGENDRLQVGIAELGKTGAETDRERVIHLLERAPETFEQRDITFPCENRKSDLACVNRACSSGTCVQYSFYDPKSDRELYRCACVER